MAEINSKVEYENLIGFPQNDTNEFQYIKSSDDLINLQSLPLDNVKQELNISVPLYKNYNCIKQAPSNILNNVKKEIFTFPTMTANETVVNDITYVVSSSSNYNDTYSPWKAFNNSYTPETDAWQSAALPSVESPQWLKIYCGGQDVYPLYWTIYNCGSYTRAMKNFTIQGSNDDSEWTDLVTDINYSNIANDSFFVYSKIKNQSFKYFRILITSSNATDLVKVGEWDMIGYLSSDTIHIDSNINEENPLIYYDINGEEQTINTSLSIDVKPNSFTNIIPHMNSDAEQGWTLTGNKLNGYAYAHPYFMTSGINTPGYHCNVRPTVLDKGVTTFTRDTPFTPIAFKLRNRWDYGSGIVYEAICSYNIKNDSANVIYKTNWSYRTAQNKWYEYEMQLIEPTTSISFEVFENDNDAAYHNYGRGFELLVQDDNGTDFIEWTTSTVFLNTEDNTLIEEKGKFIISQVQPSTPKENDLWLNVLDKNQVYKFNGSEWIVTKYIPIASLVYNYYQLFNVYNFPINANWYDMTTKSMWKSPLLPVPANSWVIYPHNQSFTNIKMKSYDVILVNKNAEFGYEPGEIAQGVSMDFVATDNRYPTVYLNDKYIGIKTGSLNSGISILQKNTATEQYINVANWYLMFRIW